MKKKTIIVIICIAIVSFWAVAYGIGIMSKKPIYNEKTGKYEVIKNHLEYINTRKEADESKLFDNIPVYDHNDILHDNMDVGFFLGRDAGKYTGANSRRDFSKAIFTAFPTEAIREISKKGDVYALYDTDIGIRLYLFFSKEKNNYLTLEGFPVIMQKQLNYKDFIDIKVGDKASLVESIDPIISQYVRFFDTGSDEALKGYTKRGAGPTSIHLLTDGILKIEYERISLGDYKITNIEYKEDFILSGFYGDTCYKIAECDYVQN